MLKKLIHLLPKKHKLTPSSIQTPEQAVEVDTWQAYRERLVEARIAIPTAKNAKAPDARLLDEDKLYQIGPSFIGAIWECIR